MGIIAGGMNIADAEDLDLSPDEVKVLHNGSGASLFASYDNVTFGQGAVIDFIGDDLERSVSDLGARYTTNIGVLNGDAIFYVAARNRLDSGYHLLETDNISITTAFNGNSIGLAVYSKEGAIKADSYDSSDPTITAPKDSLKGKSIVPISHTWGSRVYTPVLKYTQGDPYGSGDDQDLVYVKAVNTDGSAEVNENVLTMADASFTTNEMFLVEMNNLQKRMGDLRGTNPQDAGFWVRYNGSKLEANSGRDASLKYNMVQLGYDKDKKVADGIRYNGVAISHATGTSEFASGQGDIKQNTLSLYQTWIGDSGHYYDLIGKIGRYNHDYTTVLDGGLGVASAEYDKTAVSISGEYGYRMQLDNGTYLEPSGELILGYMSDADYTIQDSIAHQNSNKQIIARAGAAYGKDYDNGSSIYTKLNMYHNFGNDLSISLDDVNYARDTVKDWFEWSVGGAVKAGKNCQVYGELAKNFGDLKSNVTVNAGARWSF